MRLKLRIACVLAVALSAVANAAEKNPNNPLITP